MAGRVLLDPVEQLGLDRVHAAGVTRTGVAAGGEQMLVQTGWFPAVLAAGSGLFG